MTDTRRYEKSDERSTASSAPARADGRKDTKKVYTVGCGAASLPGLPVHEKSPIMRRIEMWVPSVQTSWYRPGRERLIGFLHRTTSTQKDGLQLGG